MIQTTGKPTSLVPATTPWVKSITPSSIVSNLKPAFTRASQHLAPALQYAKTWGTKSIVAATTALVTMKDAIARPLSVTDNDGSWISRSSLGVVETLADHSVITGLVCFGITAAVVAVPTMVMLGGGGLVYQMRRTPQPQSGEASGNRFSISPDGQSAKPGRTSGIFVGQILATKNHRYKVLAPLGAGGMANVYLVEREKDGQLQVFKTMNEAMAKSQVGVEKFMKEIQFTKDLTEKGVRNLVEAREILGEPFGVFLEYMPERDLSNYLNKYFSEGQDVPLNDILQILNDIAVCLSDLNKHGLAHRDLKPENVFLYKDDNGRIRAKIGDLGLAKNVNLRQTQAAQGTPYFMAPEQFQFKADIRSDIFALGIIMFEAFTKKHPFGIDEIPFASAEQVLKNFLSGRKATDIETLRSDLPETLSAIIMKCLEISPEKRPQKPEELVTVFKYILLELNPTMSDETFAV